MVTPGSALGTYSYRNSSPGDRTQNSVAANTEHAISNSDKAYRQDEPAALAKTPSVVTGSSLLFTAFWAVTLLTFGSSVSGH